MKKIFVIGDSISIQYGPYLKAYLSEVMEYSRKAGEEEALKDLDIPTGANGGDSSMVLQYLQAMLAQNAIDADFILVNCGLHDIKTDPQTGKKQIPLDQYEKNLQDIVSLTKQYNKALVWLQTTPADEHIHNTKPDMPFHRYAADVTACNNIAEKVMSEHLIPIIDLYTFTMNLNEDLYCDHVHFNESVRALQAAFIAGWLGR